MTSCLDAWAIMAWLDGDEVAGPIVDGALAAGATMSWINVGEVYYIVRRAHGQDESERVLAGLRSVVRLDDATPTRVLEAARIKAAKPMSLGDSFAVATAAAHRVPLLTGDDEILDAGGLDCQVVDIRV